MLIISQDEGRGHPHGRPPTAIQCALALVTAGLAVAAVMLALIMSVPPAQADYLPAALPEEEPQHQGSVFAQPPLQEQSERQGSVFAQFQPQAGPYRQGSVFIEFYPQPEPSFTPFPPLSSTTMTPLPFMPMPVEGTWVVTCGYRCGLHNAANNITFALDIVPVEGGAAGQPVRSPVDGQIIAVVDSATFFCNGEWIGGPQGGSVIIIDFQNPADTRWRLRLVHLDPATVSDDLRPDGEPVPVTAGTFLGNLAPLKGCGHLHMSLGELDEHGEVPEPLVIEGTPLEDCDGADCWDGTLLPPEGP